MKEFNISRQNKKQMLNHLLFEFNFLIDYAKDTLEKYGKGNINLCHYQEQAVQTIHILQLLDFTSKEVENKYIELIYHNRYDEIERFDVDFTVFKGEKR